MRHRIRARKGGRSPVPAKQKRNVQKRFDLGEDVSDKNPIPVKPLNLLKAKK